MSRTSARRAASQPALDRRDLFRLAAAQLFGAALVDAWLPGVARAADSASASPLPPLNRFTRMVHEYFVTHVRRIERQSLQQKNKLASRAEAEAHVEQVRRKIQESFGPWPEKTPLNPRVTGVVERDAYRIEKVIFESRPGFLVTANLYVPSGRKLPLPGVVGTCGHSVNGKAAEAYQSFAQGLARQGYVVLIYDPIGQGERLQYTDEQFRPRRGTGTSEHLYAGNQQFLVGEFFGSWRAWDGIRALDYLLTREEVDAAHVGVTGNSGGGTMTTWLCGVEPRWTMAAPSCFVTTFLHNLENELPADTEQCPPRALALGLDHDDFLAAMAPKPVLIMAKELDYFDARGSEETLARLKRLYGLLGAEENVALFIGPTYHGYTQENREAMYRWFNRVTRVSQATTEPELTIERDESLWCTPHGQVAELSSRTVFSFTQARSQELGRRRRGLEGTDLTETVQRVLRIAPRSGVADYRILRPLRSRGYPKPHAAVYAVETEPGIQALVYRLSDAPLMSRPPRNAGRAVLYVAHQSSDAELRDEPLVGKLLDDEPDAAFYTCDVRGIGESRPDTCGMDQFRKPYGNDYFYAIHSIMLDRPYLGQKTFDVLRVIDWLAAHEHREIHLAGKGWGALVATFAALLADPVRQVTLKNSLVSYSAVAESEEYAWPLSSLVPGILRAFDLPDCYRALEAKKLALIDPWGPTQAMD